MLFIGYYGELAAPEPPALWQSLLSLAFRAIPLCLAAAVLNRLTRPFLERLPTAGRRRLALWVDLGLRTAMTAAFADGLLGSAFPWSLSAALGTASAGDSFIFQLMGMAPFPVFFFCAWAPMYRFHAATVPGTWTRASFLIHKARYSLFLLLAWIPFAALVDWLSGFLLAVPAALLLAIWSFPMLLTRIWGCQRLSDAETLARMRRLEECAGTGFSRVYLWEPGGGHIENAAAVGILPPFRYLFLTPALLRDMDGPELDAVILHELGHVRNRHLLFYFFSSLAGVNAAALAAAFAPLSGNAERFAAATVLILLYFRLVFGWLSRNMERQADLFALEKSGSARGLANALEKLGLAAGHIRLAESWHHSGIAERVRILRRAEAHPHLIARHNARAARLKAAGYAAALSLLTLMTLAATGGGGGETGKRGAAEATEAHWRRIMRVFPEHPAPRLRLARLLDAESANRDETPDRTEALQLARSVIRLDATPEEREEARKLADKLERKDAP